jgi:hypothetical protein
MGAYLIRQLVADRRADLAADAGRRHLAQQTRIARGTAVRTVWARLMRPLRLANWLRVGAGITALSGTGGQQQSRARPQALRSLPKSATTEP